MTAQDLAENLEGHREGHEWRCRCPVHGGRSLSIREKDGKILVVCRAGCSQGEVVKALQEAGLWGSGTGYEIPPPTEPSKDDTERRADRASDLWNETHPIEPNDPVGGYLRGRGIVLNTWPEDLRTHPRLDYWEVSDGGNPIKTGTFPAMLAVIRNPQGHPVGIHRTWIAPDGSGKALVDSPKKIYKVGDLSGSAVRLFPPRDGLLGVTEGIEDALSAMILWSLPCWACLGTSGLKGFEPPEEVGKLIVFSDNDEPGKKAAMELAGRLKKTMAVGIRIPSGHKDINALLMEGVTHAV